MNKLENRISSREIAEMMGKEHKNVLKKIDDLNKDLIGLTLSQSKYWIEGEYTDGQNRKYREYKVTELGCELIAHKTIGKEGTEFTVKYMDRFHKMKEIIEENKPQLPSYVEALRQLADTLEEKEKLEEENKELLPKAEAYDAFLNEDGLINMGDLAKIIGYGRNTFMKMLRKDGILMSSNVPYQRYIDYFEVKVVRKNGEDYKCSLANKKGLDFLTKKYMRKVKKPCIKK